MILISLVKSLGHILDNVSNMSWNDERWKGWVFSHLNIIHSFTVIFLHNGDKKMVHWDRHTLKEEAIVRSCCESCKFFSLISKDKFVRIKCQKKTKIQNIAVIQSVKLLEERKKSFNMYLIEAFWNLNWN